MTTSIQPILNQERDLLREAKLDLVRQALGLAKVEKILDRECERDRLSQADRHALLGVLDIVMLADGDRSVADFTLAGKLDAVFAGFNQNCSQHILSAHCLVVETQRRQRG